MYIDTTIPQIDIANAPTCLACPLAECVYMFRSAEIRRACPVWQAGEASRERVKEYRRRWREKQRRARLNLTDERDLK